MKFHKNYPYQPPTFRFSTRNIIHPNVYSDGNLCISILHSPGEDATSGESASERWNALHGVESVLRSVLLLLDDPEIGSPANVDAGILYRDARDEYNTKAREVIDRSKSDIPDGARMPTTEELAPLPVKTVEDDPDFWNITDDEEFGGSDSDMNDFEDYDDDEDEKDDRDDKDKDDK